MKNIVLLMTFSVVLVGTAFGQIEKGKYALGGNFGFNFYKEANSLSNNYSYSIDLAPSFGRFIRENLLLEGKIGYGLNHNRSNNGTSLTRTTGHEVFAMAKITKFFSITDKFHLTLAGYLSAAYEPRKSITEIGGISSTSSSFSVSSGLGARPGLAFLLNDNWLIHSSVGNFGYTMKYFETNDAISHRIGLNLEDSFFSIGIRYILN